MAKARRVAARQANALEDLAKRLAVVEKKVDEALKMLREAEKRAAEAEG